MQQPAKPTKDLVHQKKPALQTEAAVQAWR
jgi:hypothetical protein